VTHVVLICVYVDDITIASSSMLLMNKVKAQLSSRFTMKDLGEIHYMFKMEIKGQSPKDPQYVTAQVYSGLASEV